MKWSDVLQESGAYCSRSALVLAVTDQLFLEHECIVPCLGFLAYSAMSFSKPG